MFYNLFMKFNKKKLIIAFFLIIITLLSFNFLKKDEVKNKEEINKIEELENENIENIFNLKLEKESIKIYGRAFSESEVDVFVEIPAKLKNVYARVGDSINEGDLVLKLDDSVEQNNLNQAILSYNSSKAQLDKVLADPRGEDLDIYSDNISSNKANLEKTKSDINKEIENLKIFLDELLRNDIDKYFDHVDTYPVFTFRIGSNIQESKLENERNEISIKMKEYLTYSFMNDEDKLNKSILLISSFSNLTKSLVNSTQDLLGFSDFDLETKEVESILIKSYVDAKYSLFKNLETTFIAQNNNLNSSEKNYDKLTSGATFEDINISNSQLNLASNSIGSARIALSKKNIVAPISGKITKINRNIGQLLNSSVLAFSISNPGNLRIEVGVPYEYLNDIYIGKEVLVSKKYKGIISRISPVINTDNGMIDIEINFIAKDDLKILSGQIVEIAFEKSDEREDNILLPISSLFEDDGKYFILVLNNEKESSRREVEFIDFKGDNIIVKNNFSDNLEIILNITGIVEGEKN